MTTPFLDAFAPIGDGLVTGNGINYNGGPVMVNPHDVYFIWYGSWAGNSALTILPEFISGLTGSPYFNINRSYANGSGQDIVGSTSMSGQIFDNYSQGANLTDATLQTVVANSISSGALPADPNGIYFVLSSADVNETSGFCTFYCGFHTHASLGGTDIKYAFVGNADRCINACAGQTIGPNGNAGADAMVNVVSHELSETVTDPDLNAWVNLPSQEDGDLCNFNFGPTFTAPNGAQANLTLGTTNFMVQQMWVNANGGGCGMSFKSSDGIGIGGYNLQSTADQAFAFDYDSSGKSDHLVLYRPGQGAIFILKNNAVGQFTPVYAQGAPGAGIGGYDLKSSLDQSFAFDYDSSGKLDHLVFYRPGSGVLFIVKNTGGAFTPVFQTFVGLGGYDLRSTADRAFAFDYDGSGKLDHLALYRPGSGVFFVLKNTGGAFTPVFQTFVGLGGYDLRSTADRAFAFDYDGSGKLDHLALYRPGSGVFFVLQNTGGAFTSVFQTFVGLGGYDLRSAADRAFAFDYDGSGKLDHLAIYRPGSGVFFVIKNTGGTFTPLVQAFGNIGGFNLASPADQVFGFDYVGNGKQDHLVLFRPGTGIIWIEQNSNGTFNPLYL